MTNKQQEPSTTLYNQTIEEQLRNFLFFASIDYKNKNNSSNNSDMHDLFHSLKTELCTNKELPFDVISLITNENNGINGWLDSSKNLNINRYKLDRLQSNINNKEMNVNSNNFSGVIDFRKELLESAITGGYLKNINEKNIFAHISLLPISFKSILENCPNEVLAYGKKNILANIDNLRKHQFISASECTEWKNSFENQIADYPNFPSNQNKKKFFISFIDNIMLKVSNKSELKKNNFK